MDDDLTRALVTETDAALRLAGRRLKDLTEYEFWWEPVPGCWTVRRAGEAVPGVVSIGGEWEIDGLFTYPDPPPFTTIGWRLNHMTIVVAGYHDLLEEPERDVPVSATAKDAVEWWTWTASSFRNAVARLTHGTAHEQVHVPHWGRSVERWTIVGGVLREQIHHGAEIGVLRDLYRHRA